MFTQLQQLHLRSNFVQKLSAMSGGANVDCFCILPEKRIVDDSIFSWVAGFEEAVSTEFFDFEKA